MKEKVLSLAKGNFTYEKPELRVNPQQLTGKVSAGGSLKCVMTVENSRGTKVKGFGSTMDPEVHFLPVFHGVHNELEVEFDAGSREPGQELVGTVSIVTDCGEVEIPYQIKVVREVIQTTSGVKVDDYYHLQSYNSNICSPPKYSMHLFGVYKFVYISSFFPYLPIFLQIHYFHMQ